MVQILWGGSTSKNLIPYLLYGWICCSFLNRHLRRFFNKDLTNGIRKIRWDWGISKISPEMSFSEKFLTLWAALSTSWEFTTATFSNKFSQ
jgi:hypothetical protein